MMINTQPLVGQHCETTTVGTLLGQLGIHLSEPMLFGLGEGLAYTIWKMKTMDFPFLGGRIKPDLITENIATNLGLLLTVKETTSRAKAWRRVKELLDAGRLVGLKLDCYHLEYFSQPTHFAGHYVAIRGYDDHQAFLVDTQQQGTTAVTSLESLALARNEKGPMSSRNRYFTLAIDPEHPQPMTRETLAETVTTAIRKNAATYLNPPIKNLCYKGIEKTSREILCWYDTSDNVQEEFATTAMLMERAGTGGALFRNMYRDFLQEAHQLTGAENINAAHSAFVNIAHDWSQVIALFEQVGATGDRTYVEQASELLKSLAKQEQAAMQLLL